MEEKKSNELANVSNGKLFKIILEQDGIGNTLQCEAFSVLIANMMYGGIKGNEDTIKKYVSGVLQEIRTNKNLADCSPKSIVLSMLTSANLQLPVDAKHYGYLVPYKNECTFEIGYQAYLHWAKKDPDIDNIQPFVVYDCDEFEYWSDDSGNHYKYKPNFADKTTSSQPKYGVAVLRYKQNVGRQPQIVVMTYKEIEKIMPKYKNGETTPFWKNHKEEMIKKTVVRRLGKWFIKDTDLEKLDEIDNGKFHNEAVYINENGEIEKNVIKDEEEMLDVSSLQETVPLE